MQLNPTAFNTHLNGFAEPFVFRKAFACPCVNADSGSPKPNCPRCYGKGWLWAAPASVTAAVASSGVQQQWAKFGSYQAGDLVLSIPNSSGLYEIAPFDRVTHLTNTDQISQALVRGAHNERLQGTVDAVLRVFWLDEQSEIVEGVFPTVGEHGALVWPESGAPAPGQTYSITFRRFADYFCFGSFSVDRMKHGGLRLPRKMVLRVFDLLGRVPGGDA